MASKPGILTDWPWKPLGSFKYVILSPWVVHSIFSFTRPEDERDLGYLLIFPFLLLRMAHNQIWISVSRYRTAEGENRIVDKGIEFDQVDRERNWDDQILLNGMLFYIGYTTIPRVYSKLDFWRTDGIILTILLHSGPVEFLYYWFHRALHHHFLYSRYHSHHHSSIVTEPITSVIHPFAEHLVYFTLFSIPLLTTMFTKTASIASFFGYILYIDFMNNLGHCNFEFIPKRLFSIFPLLKYLMYTPSFHSLHHTQFRTNYSLFMPLYDYIYGTIDKASDALYENCIKRSGSGSADVVHLTHLTSPHSIYFLRFGIPSLASNPQTSDSISNRYLWLFWPFTCFSAFLAWIHNSPFISETNTFHKLKLHTWFLPRYTVQYLASPRQPINSMIERAILEADKRRVKVVTLGLLNQGEELNRNGEMYIQKYPQLKTKLVDGSSLAVAILLNTIPKQTTQLLFRGKLTKVACATVSAFCQMGIQVVALRKDEYAQLKHRLNAQSQDNLVLSKSYAQNKIWLVGEELREEEQLKASKGTLFIPFTQLPPRKVRKDCFYHTTPAMIVPPSLDNMHSCENWLPRRVMSSSRVAGIIHALEGWDLNECGQTMCDVEQVWQATLRHGFLPLRPVAKLPN